VRGEVYEPLVVAPRITANLGQKAFVFNGNEPKTVEVVFTAHTQKAIDAVAFMQLPTGWRAAPEQLPLHFSEKSDEITAKFTVYPATNASLSDSLNITLKYGDSTETAHAIRSIAHDHIPRITWFPPSTARLSKIETAVSATRIGYLPGAGDLIPQALREIGLQVDILDENDVLSDNLSQYDAIVTGIRLYNVNEQMRRLQPHLLSYVKNGGTLVEQYNVSGGLRATDLGPFPFALSRSRVTDETAPVSILTPDSRVLN